MVKRNNQSQSKQSPILLVSAIIIVVVFFITWYAVGASLTVKQQEAHQRNDQVVLEISQMDCIQLREYIADHKYLYSYASERYHGRCE